MNSVPYPKATPIAAIQRAVVKELLDAKKASGEIKSTLEYQTEFDAAIAKIEGGTLFTRERKQSGTTDAEAFNGTFTELGIDLSALYRALDGLEESTASHVRLTHSTLSSVHMRTKALNNTLTRQETLLGRRSADDLHVETFASNSGFTQQQTWYTERDGRQTSVDYRASWEPATESIRLPAAFTDNALRGAGGVRLGNIRITKQLGSEQMRAEHEIRSIDNALDEDPSTYWSESILMDQPIEVDMGEAYHGIDFGAAVELEVRFDHLSTVNEMLLHPFAEYPMDVVAVTAFETDDPEEVGRVIVQGPIELPGEKLFRFADTNAKRVRLLLNQRHFVRRDFLASDRTRRNLALQAGEPTEVDASLTADAVLSAIRKDTHQRLVKCEYQYGLYNVSFRRNEFHTTGIYVSDSIPVAGNIKNFRLETTESHPHVEGAPAFSDIEYAVHDGNQWHDILPFNKTAVDAELLLPKLNNGRHEATTRFVVASGFEVLKDGQPVGDKAVLLTDGQTVVFAEYDPSAFYTASYIPSPDTWSVDFAESARDFFGTLAPKRVVETFQGTNQNNTVQLSRHPFIDRARLNAEPYDYDASYLANDFVPIEVTLLDSSGYRIEQPFNEQQTTLAIRNRTDYLGGGTVYLDPFDDHTTFYQYVVEGDTIRFNVPIPSDTRVIVSYPSLVSDVRLRAILRRNSASHHGLTPVLEGYVAHSQVLK